MPTHLTSAYKDGHQWVVFCKKCGFEEPFESQECSERYVNAHEEKIPFTSGLPLDENERSK